MDDGIFYMSISDFLKFFYKTTTALYQDWEQDNMQNEWDRSDSMPTF